MIADIQAAASNVALEKFDAFLIRWLGIKEARIISMIKTPPMNSIKYSVRNIGDAVNQYLMAISTATVSITATAIFMGFNDFTVLKSINANAIVHNLVIISLKLLEYRLWVSGVVEKIFLLLNSCCFLTSYYFWLFYDKKLLCLILLELLMIATLSSFLLRCHGGSVNFVLCLVMCAMMVIDRVFGIRILIFSCRHRFKVSFYDSL